MDIGFAQYRLRCQLLGHEDYVRGICVCDNDGIATSSRDRTIRFWSVDQTNNAAYTCSKILLGHTSFVGPLAWAPANEQFPEGALISGGTDTLVLVWDLATGEKVQTLKGHSMPVTAVTLDGSDIVSSSFDCTLRHWKGEKQSEVWKAHKEPIQAVRRLPTGELITASSDCTIKLWKGSICTHTFLGHTDTVRGLAIMPELGILSASHDCSIKLWALNGKILLEMVGHTAIVYSVDANKSGLVVSGSEDGLAKIWKDGVCVQSIEHPGSVWDVKFLENGDIVTACSDGVARVWTVHPDKIADSLELEAYASLLSQHKGSRKRAGGLKLKEVLRGLEALQISGGKKKNRKRMGVVDSNKNSRRTRSYFLRLAAKAGIEHHDHGHTCYLPGDYEIKSEPFMSKLERDNFFKHVKGTKSDEGHGCVAAAVEHKDVSQGGSSLDEK